MIAASKDLEQRRDACNGSRFRPGETGGLYESYFLRANHPERPLAFWIRYTVFCPKGRPQEAQGELWAIWFDGETQQIAAVKESLPIADCLFSPGRLDVRIGDATLTASHGPSTRAARRRTSMAVSRRLRRRSSV